MINKVVVALEYDGTSFNGSQKQDNVRTIQGVFDQVLEEINKEPVASEFASRTDSGVHATHQVASFVSDKYRTNSSWASALNYYLPREYHSSILLVKWIFTCSAFIWKLVKKENFIREFYFRVI